MFWKGKCFGSATVGPKGEIVIPAQARRAFGIARGDKLLVFGRAAAPRPQAQAPCSAGRSAGLSVNTLGG